MTVAGDRTRPVAGVVHSGMCARRDPPLLTSLLFVASALAGLAGCQSAPLPLTRPSDPLLDSAGGYSTVALDSGVRYRDLRLGRGEPVTDDAIIDVRFTEKSSDGRVFDETGDAPRRLMFNRLIAGWRQGLAGMREGGVRRLVVPPESGYGQAGYPKRQIPPGVTLVYSVELIAVYRQDEPADAPEAVEPSSDAAAGDAGVRLPAKALRGGPRVHSVTPRPEPAE